MWYQKPLELGLRGATSEVDHSDHDQDGLTQELWFRPDTLVLPLLADQAVTDAEGRLALVDTQQIAEQLKIPHDEVPLYYERLYLGRVSPEEGLPDDGISVVGETAGGSAVPVLALILDQAGADRFGLGSWRSLRDIALDLNLLDAGLLTRAVALSNWHSAHSFSPKTGNPLKTVKGGWVRIDSADGSEHFPRTDPAVIVAVNDKEGRILLASNASWDSKMFSLIAGFVDPGESLEEAVVREVWEETRVRVTAPKYIGSQPWPFPASLMLGFQADAVEFGEAKPDGVEIRELRWFTREELLDAVESSEVAIPAGVSISRAIIDAWLAG